MVDYVAPDPSVAEFIHGKNEVVRQYERQIEQFGEQETRDLVGNSDQPSDLRVLALLQLVPRRSRERRAELLSDFLDDPDPDVSATALQYCPLLDERCLEKARRMVNVDHVRVRCEAIVALAKAGDDAILPQLLDWFAGDDQLHRNLAIEGLKTLGTQQAMLPLQESYDGGGRDETDRAVLAVALLRLGDTRGLGFLTNIASRAEGPLSVMAATWLYYEHDSDRGLQLMLHILDKGDLEAKQNMVQQIWNLAHLPHAFTADGIHEARLWVQQKRESTQKRSP